MTFISQLDRHVEYRVGVKFEQCTQIDAVNRTNALALFPRLAASPVSA